MHAYLITESTQQDRTEHIANLLRKWGVHAVDTISLSPGETGTIGIDDIRESLIRFSHVPLHSPNSVLLISSAETLTDQAQQALLKTIEEPPMHGRVLLSSPQESLLLPTILSRCLVIRLTQPERSGIQHSSLFSESESTARLSVGKQLLALEGKAKTKHEALEWIEELLQEYYREFLRSNAHSVQIRRLLEAKKHLIANVNPQLVIDQLFLATD